MNVVFAGELGLIGLHVTDACLGLGHHVLVIDSEMITDGYGHEEHPSHEVPLKLFKDFSWR